MTEKTRPAPPVLDTSTWTEGQRRGADCVDCGRRVSAATAVVLPALRASNGVRLFPRAHAACPSGRRAARTDS